MSSSTQASAVTIDNPAHLQEDQALRILTDAALCIGDFVNLARKAISAARPEVLARIINEEPTEVAPEPDGRKRPRGSMPPILAVMKMMIAACRLLPRIVNWTNPTLSPNGSSGSLDSAAASAEEMMSGLSVLMRGMGSSG